MSTQIMKQIERTLRNGPGGQGPLVSVADHARQLSVDELSYLIQATSPTESAELFQALDAETRLRVFQDLAPAYQASCSRCCRARTSTPWWRRWPRMTGPPCSISCPPPCGRSCSPRSAPTSAR
ncbi:hypothetical protein [Arthrobacter sp. JCM 19049]|uniref:hypothetical protein n=1 Tax=Arthrobacter sp. JCM 19049 TaxID=1460643 RepID=UPI002436B90A|nr:hypothetical protein [Arthrobacter sp. JCM 19049]